MLKKIGFSIWICILVLNTICIGITFMSWIKTGPAYKCNASEVAYINEKLGTNYDFDYMMIFDNHLENRIIIIEKNKIPFFNLLSGTKIIIEKQQNLQLYEDIKYKFQNTELVELPNAYIPYLVVYILLGLSYFFIKEK